MIALYISLILVVCAFIGLYLYFFIRRLLRMLGRDTAQKRTKALIIGADIVILVLCLNIFSVSALLLLHAIFISMALDLLIKLIRRFSERETKKTLFEKLVSTGALAIAVSTVAFIYGYFNMMNVERTEYTVISQKELSRDYKVALISDLHLGTGIGLEALEETLDGISAEYPDVLILDGDIFDEDTTLEDMKAAAAAFGNVRSAYGVYYVYGNHDANTYSSSPDYGARELKEELEKNEITILSDESVFLNDELLLAGRADPGFSRDTERAPTSSLIEKAGNEDFVLLLDHQPIDFSENKAAGVDLQLSGHTHGGQIFPLGFLYEPIGSADLCYGHKSYGNFQAIVSSGIAGWGYPIRTQAHSEYVIITIKN